MSERHNQRAIVIGCSIAGLLTARVLAEHFGSVMVLERERLPSTPNARRGVPQSVQPHILLAKGYEILRSLLPTIGTELPQRGALEIDWAREFYHFGEAGWSANAQSPSKIISFTCSRPLLEWTIRQQVSQFQNVQILEDCRVCSNCGAQVKKSLSTRTHTCACGAELGRDQNAARNILMKGLNAVGRTVYACGEDISLAG